MEQLTVLATLHPYSILKQLIFILKIIILFGKRQWPFQFSFSKSNFQFQIISASLLLVLMEKAPSVVLSYEI